MTTHHFHYCTLNGNLGIIIPFGLFLIVLSFYVLGSTADAYLSPALETISLKLKMSESLAGVTLLAFGNGAADVLSAFSASGGEDGTYLALGALLGAGLFVTCIVAAAVLLSSKHAIHVLPRVILRDIAFYMLGPVLLLIASLTGELSLIFAILFVVLYGVFV
jgi:sodium/potassium/calcium exchanger 6